MDASGQNFVSDYASSLIYRGAIGRQEMSTGFYPVGFLALDPPGSEIEALPA